MAQTTRKLSFNKFAYTNIEHQSDVIDISSATDCMLACYKSGIIYSYFYAGFSDFPSTLKNNRLYSVTVTMQVTGGQNIPCGAFISGSDFDPLTLTWSNKPGALNDSRLRSPSFTYPDTDILFSQVGDSLTNDQKSLFTSQVLQAKALGFYQAGYNPSTFTSFSIYKTLHDGTAPYIEVTYDDNVKVNSKIAENGCPTSGYFDPRNARKFAWTYEVDDDYYCAGAFTQQAATFYWRVSGASSWSSIAASGSTQNVTVPANTFPINSTIEWYLAGTDTNGCVSTSPVYTISTAASLLSASPIAPVNSVEDGSKDLTFSWSLEDNANTKGVWIGYTTTEGGTLTALADLPTGGAVTSWTAAGGTFPAGTIYWGIRAYNMDGVLGPTGAAQFLSVAAPAAPQGLSATPVPFTTISWQSAEQQAYRITIDGATAATGFGTAKSFPVAEPLADGIHVIGVSVQGLYGMWSEESTTSISIENSAEGSVTLTGVFDIDADLTWESTESNAAAFYIYRDGDRIASTAGTSYTDRVALGAHSYTVLQKLEDGNYLQSEPIAGEMTVRSPMIGLLHEAGWLQLRLSENSDRTQGFTYSRKHSLRHIAGTAYPYLEISPYEDASGSYDCAFVDTIDAQTFEAMKGKPVIMKNRDGSVIVGLLASLQKTVREFYFSYSFTIQQIHWEGFIHADD